MLICGIGYGSFSLFSSQFVFDFELMAALALDLWTGFAAGRFGLAETEGDLVEADFNFIARRRVCRAGLSAFRANNLDEKCFDCVHGNAPFISRVHRPKGPLPDHEGRATGAAYPREREGQGGAPTPSARHCEAGRTRLLGRI